MANLTNEIESRVNFRCGKYVEDELKTDLFECLSIDRNTSENLKSNGFTCHNDDGR